MASSIPSRPLVLAFSILLLLLPLSLCSSDADKPKLTYHGGPLLTGNLPLGLIWYGSFGRPQKNVIRSFIKSLNYNGGANLEPQVSTWWHMVESYQSFAGRRFAGKSPRIGVKVVNQVTDATYSVGKILTVDFIAPLVKQATGGNPSVLAVIFASRDVTVQGFCNKNCAQHGVVGKQPYIIVGNPETECPGDCAWPFHKAANGPQGVTLQPPNGNIGTDAMVISLATSLAETVTNPFKTGFYEGNEFKSDEAGTACRGIFGSGAFEGYTGKVRVDPKTGGAFNAHGSKGKKFLLPAIWNPKTSSCWTPM